MDKKELVSENYTLRQALRAAVSGLYFSDDGDAWFKTRDKVDAIMGEPYCVRFEGETEEYSAMHDVLKRK